MKSIGEIMRQSREGRTSNSESPALQQRTTQSVAVQTTREQFLGKYNPDYQRQICVDSDTCYFGQYPTLAVLRKTYGDNMPVMWLLPQLYDLSEYCGCKEKLQGRPMEECAFVIATEFYYLKTSELMLFFHRFKTGRYGRFYGSVDPLIITTALRDFVAERASAYERHEQEERDKREQEEKKNAMTWEEFCMKNFGEIRPNPLG